MTAENSGHHQAAGQNAISVELNDAQSIRDGLIGRDSHPAFAESVATPLVNRLIHGGETWEPQPLITLLDRHLRRYFRRAKSGIRSYEEVQQEYGSFMVGAIIKGSESQQQTLELWNERVEEAARTKHLAGEAKRREAEGRRQAEIRKKLGQSGLSRRVTLPSQQTLSARAAIEKREAHPGRGSKSASQQPPKQTAKGTKPKKGRSKKQRAVRGGSSPDSAKAAYKQSVKAPQIKHRPAPNGVNRGNGDRGFYNR